MEALLPWVDRRVQIDGNAGLVVVNPDQAVARYYQQEARVQAQIRRQQQARWIKRGVRKTGFVWKWRPISPIR